jgi:transcriptional regulator with XRE-family HTH domain
MEAATNVALRLRTQANLTQTQAADLIGYSRRQWIKWEQGVSPMPEKSVQAFLAALTARQERSRHSDLLDLLRRQRANLPEPVTVETTHSKEPLPTTLLEDGLFHLEPGDNLSAELEQQRKANATLEKKLSAIDRHLSQ